MSETGTVPDPVLVAAQSSLRMAEQECADLKRRLEAAEALLDPPICRLQFPDGTVPDNAKEAAEGWNRWASSLRAERDELARKWGAADAEAIKLRTVIARVKWLIQNQPDHEDLLSAIMILLLEAVQ